MTSISRSAADFNGLSANVLWNSAIPLNLIDAAAKPPAHPRIPIPGLGGIKAKFLVTPRPTGNGERESDEWKQNRWI
jgi:hypothetical protein